MKKIEGYEDYYVTESGDVISTKKHRGNSGPRKLIFGLSLGGYRNVSLYRYGVQKTHRVHRLVARAFIPNPDCKQTINHKNGIKTDNRIENLEWNTVSENTLHAYRSLGREHPRPWLGKSGSSHHRSKAVVQMDINDNEVARYGSAREAGRAGFDQANLSACCRGTRKTHRGFKWRYLDEA